MKNNSKLLSLIESDCDVSINLVDDETVSVKVSWEGITDEVTVTVIDYDSTEFKQHPVYKSIMKQVVKRLRQRAIAISYMVVSHELNFSKGVA
jgi:hypothetical protein